MGHTMQLLGKMTVATVEGLCLKCIVRSLHTTTGRARSMIIRVQQCTVQCTAAAAARFSWTLDKTNLPCTSSTRRVFGRYNIRIHGCQQALLILTVVAPSSHTHDTRAAAGAARGGRFRLQAKYRTRFAILIIDSGRRAYRFRLWPPGKVRPRSTDLPGKSGVVYF